MYDKGTRTIGAEHAPIKTCAVFGGKVQHRSHFSTNEPVILVVADRCSYTQFPTSSENIGHNRNNAQYIMRFLHSQPMEKSGLIGIAQFKRTCTLEFRGLYRWTVGVDYPKLPPLQLAKSQQTTTRTQCFQSYAYQVRKREHYDF